jgi:hypothetical protein
MPFGQQGGAYLTKQPQPEAPYPIITISDAFVQPALTGTAVFWIVKATAAAVTLAPASSVPVGTIVVFMAGNAVAHVVTAQSGGIWDGVTGSKTKWTAAAFIGSSITLMSAPNGGWATLAQQLGTVA